MASGVRTHVGLPPKLAYALVIPMTRQIDS